MMFYILVVLAVLLALAVFGLIVLAISTQEEGALGAAVFASIFGGFATIVPISTIWSNHANDLGTIAAQSEVIAVYQERVESTERRLKEIRDPKSALFNADTPVASMVESLTQAEARLADAKATRAKAILSVEQRRYGPVSGVINFAGDYKQPTKGQ